MGQCFDEHLFLQNTFYWITLALAAASRQIKMPQENKVSRESEGCLQRSLTENNFSKM